MKEELQQLRERVAELERRVVDAEWQARQAEILAVAIRTALSMYDRGDSSSANGRTIGNDIDHIIEAVLEANHRQHDRRAAPPGSEARPPRETPRRD